MLGLKIEDVRGFMSKLLKENMFDAFGVNKVHILSYMQLDILKKDGVKEGAVKWDKIKHTVFGFIKNSETPHKIKIVLGCDGNKIDIVSDVELFLNILYEKDRMLVTSGIAMDSFSSDITLEKGYILAWDNWIIDFFNKNKINYKQ